MSGLRSSRAAAGAKATGPGSTHKTNAKPLAAAGAKASGGPFGTSTHESLGRTRAKAGAKASNAGRNSIVAEGQGVGDPHGTAYEQRDRGGKSVAHPHGTERVSEHHRK